MSVFRKYLIALLIHQLVVLHVQMVIYYNNNVINKYISVTIKIKMTVYNVIRVRFFIRINVLICYIFNLVVFFMICLISSVLGVLEIIYWIQMECVFLSCLFVFNKIYSQILVSCA